MKLTVLLFSSLSFALAGWPCAGGNNGRNGLSPWPGPHERWVLWEAQSLPATISMQCYVEDSFVVTMRYSFSPMQGPLVCHDLRTGDTLWTRLYKPGGKYVPIGLKGGRAYCRDFRESGHDTIYCVDAATGSVLWQSRWTAPLGIIWDAVFADNGDPIIPGAEYGVMRLDRLTGDTVWTLDRPTPNTGAEWMAACDTVVFTWTGYINTPKRLLAVSMNTGRILDSSAALPGDGDQEQPFAIGPNGTIFAQRDGGLLYALRYTEAGFAQAWTHAGCGGSVWMNYGHSPYAPVVYVPIGRRLYALDAQTGDTLCSSADLVTSGDLVPRVSVNADGFLYVMATTGSGEGRLWCLDYGLQPMWSDPYGYSYYSGPAIGDTGIVVVAAAGTLIRAYSPATGIADAGEPPVTRLTASPNPFRHSVLLHLTSRVLDPSTPQTLSVFDPSGRRVRTLAGSDVGRRASGVAWDGTDDSGRRLPAGAYIISTAGQGRMLTARVVLTH